MTALIVTETVHCFEKWQMSHLSVTIISSLTYFFIFFFVRHVGGKHSFEFFSSIQCISSKVQNLYGHRETASVITLQCTHLSFKWVFECVCNLVLIQWHCRRSENILLAEKILIASSWLQWFSFFFQFFTPYYEQQSLLLNHKLLLLNECRDNSGYQISSPYSISPSAKDSLRIQSLRTCGRQYWGKKGPAV